MTAKIRFFVRGIDQRPCAGVHVNLIAELAAPNAISAPGYENHQSIDAGKLMMLEIQRDIAREFGLGKRTVVATAFTDFNGYAVFDLSALPDRQARLVAATLKLSLLDRRSDLSLSLLPPLNGTLSLLANLNQFFFATTAELNDAVRNAWSLAFEACQALVINTGEANVEAGATVGMVQAPDACDYELSPASFVARTRSRIGDDGCEHLVPSAFPVREAAFSRLVVASKATKPVATETEHKHGLQPALPSLDDEPTLFKAVQWGELLEFRQTWFSLGHSLGEIKYSLPLAPGEAVRIAVVDYSRTDGVLRKDDIHYAEKLRHLQSRTRDIDNIVSGSLDENQSGNSTMVGGAVDVEYKPTDKLSIGGTVGAANSVSYSDGNRDLAAKEQQNIHDVVMQRSSAYRDLSSSTVVQASQNESNQIATRIVANMNRGHALTINYYEILRHLLVRTEFKGRQTAILVPVQPIEFTLENIPRFRNALEARLLDARQAGGFDAIDRQQAGPGAYAEPPAEIPPAPAPAEVKTPCTLFDITIVSGKHGGSEEADTWGRIVISLKTADGKVTALFTKGFGLPNSFNNLGSDKSGGTVNPIRTFKVQPALTQPIYLEDIRFLQVGYTSDIGNLADAWNAQSVDVSARLSDVPSLLVHSEYKTTLVSKANEQMLPDAAISWQKPASATPDPIPSEDPPAPVLPAPTETGDAAAAKMLMNHLNANGIFYSMTIWANLNKSERKLRLRAMLGETSQLVGDEIINVVGNMLAFRYYGAAPDWMARKDPVVPAKSESITTLPTRGVFAEAHLGNCNAAEKRDITRLWNFAELPVSLLPNIEGLTPGPKGTPNTGISQNALPSTVLNIVNPQAAPDPTGMANALTLLRTPEIFRNMSGLQQTSALLGQLIQSAQAPSLNGSQTKTPAQQQQIDKLTAAKAAVDTAMLGASTVSSDHGVNTRPSATEAYDNLTVSHDVAAASHDLGWSPATTENVTSGMVGGGGGSGGVLGMAMSMIEGGTAPVHIRGLSGLGNARGSGTTTGEQILDGTKFMLSAIATGIADWKDAPDQELADAVVHSIETAVIKAADDATDTIPMVKAIKVSVELGRIFADEVGKALVKTNAVLSRSYRVGELVGGGSDGLSPEDIEAIQNCRRWQANSVGQINSILLAGIEAVVENLISRALTWVSSEVINGASSVAKQLVGHYLNQSGVQAMLADGLTELGSGIDAKNAKFYKEVGSTVIGLYIRQLRAGSVRTMLTPYAKMGGNKSVEKMLLAAFASMLVDPVVRSMNAGMKKIIAAEAKALVVELRAAGHAVMGGAILSAEASKITLPRSALNEIEAGADSAAAEAERDLEQLRTSIEPLIAATKARAYVLGGMRQRGMVRAMERWTVNAEPDPWTRISGKYLDEVRDIVSDFEVAATNLLAGLDTVTRARAVMLWFTLPLVLPRLSMDDPSVWTHWDYDIQAR